MFSCDYESDYGVVIEYEVAWNGTKTIKCAECGCELAPGHTVNVTIISTFRDEPFEDMDEDELEEVVADEDTVIIHTCDKCYDLSESLVDIGWCWDYGNMWHEYREWLWDIRKVGLHTAPGRSVN